MGLWNGVVRMLQGKPVFQAEKRENLPYEAMPVRGVADKTPVDSKGQKIIPRVSVERCKSHINGDTMLVTAWITNESDALLELDKIVIMDQKSELDYRIEPGRAHEFRLYSGPILRNDAAKTAGLYYKLVSRSDYFRAECMVEYDYEADGSYLVSELHPEKLVHDL